MRVSLDRLQGHSVVERAHLFRVLVWTYARALVVILADCILSTVERWIGLCVNAVDVVYLLDGFWVDYQGAFFGLEGFMCVRLRCNLSGLLEIGRVGRDRVEGWRVQATKSLHC